MEQHGSKYFAHRHTLNPLVGVKTFFSESSYKRKYFHEILANRLIKLVQERSVVR